MGRVCSSCIHYFGCAIAVIAGLALAGCHATVTYQLDIHADNTVTVASKVVMDDQMYQLAQSQSTSNDPFGVKAARSKGFTVIQTVDDNDNHVVTETTTVPIAELATNGVNLAGKSMPLSADQFQMHTDGLYDVRTLNYSFPALFPEKANNSYAALGSEMLAASLSPYLELRLPGTVVSTNGEIKTDGFVRYDIGLQNPTEIHYEVRSLNPVRVGLLILAIVVFGSLAGLIVFSGITSRRAASSI